MRRFISALLMISMLTACFGFAVPSAAEAVPADAVVVDLNLTAPNGTLTDIKVGDKTIKTERNMNIDYKINQANTKKKDKTRETEL